MLLLIIGFFVIILCAFASLLAGRARINPGLFSILGNFSALVLSSRICIKSILLGKTFDAATTYPLPFGSVSFGLDPLSAFFLLPLLGISLISSIYGVRYLEKTFHGKNTAPAWFFFNILIASMFLVLVSRNVPMFIVSWEMMSISSYFLVVLEHEKKKVCEAGWVYLVSTHIGCAFIIATFVLIGRSSGNMDFSSMKASGAGLSGTLIFLFALIGFGSKAGIMPMHIWLPQAHPAAPSHVSAIMSGIMIKMGIYGLLRTISFMSPIQLWWGLALVIVGILSGIMGVLYALAQHDLKRILAYSSVENIGVISLGLGIGLVGHVSGNPIVAFLGLSGALLHVVNHCIFKSLLFMGAGSVIYKTGTGEMDLMGGLGKRMPGTAIGFLTGSASISGLPPFNGFVGEFLIFLACLKSLGSSNFALFVAGISVLISLGLIGGLAAACFTKAFGVVFLGENRSENSSEAYDDVPLSMRIPMYILAAMCLGIGLLAPLFLDVLYFPAAQMLGGSALNGTDKMFFFRNAFAPLFSISAVSFLLIVVAGLIWVFRNKLKGKAKNTESCTWDCGYIRPVNSMQYTSSSFVQPLTKFFHELLGTVIKKPDTSSLFPEDRRFTSHTPDFFMERVLVPIFKAFSESSEKLIRFDNVNVHVSILYIIITTILLLIYNYLL